MRSTEKCQDQSVLVTGAGPTGCTLALLLARAGIPVTLIEQNAEPQQHPAACILNTRTMEIFREIGIEQQIRGACQNIFERGWITWAVSLAGRELGRCSAVPDNLEKTLALSPTHTTQFPQHMLEPMLWRAIEQQPTIDFRKNHRLVSIQNDWKGVTAILASSGEKKLLRGAFLVGCDGAASVVRRSLGIAMDGPVLQHMIGIHFHADLGNLVNHRKSILYWILNKDLLGVLIAHWLPTEWVLFAPYFPPQQRPEEFTESVCLELVRKAVGESPDEVQIQRIRPWVLAARLARSFQHGRVFLGGDAAHCFPPTGGLGLNTGVQDAHNLAWKLAAVLKGRAHADLLYTYASERRPIARTNLDHSVRNFANMNALNQVAGLDWKQLKTLEAIQTSRFFRWLPSRLQQGLVDFALKFGMKRLARLDASGPDGEKLRSRFRALLPGQEPHYRFLGIDLGFAYTEGVVLPEPTRKPDANNPVVDYLPTTWPGARLPHLWVRRGPDRLALHDLLDGERFLLLTHPSGRQCWGDAVTAVQNCLAFPISCLSIGAQGAADLIDEQGVWPRLSEVEETGAVLVRPDGHVAWRCQEAPPDPPGLLLHVMRKILASGNGGVDQSRGCLAPG
jgi:2-polyprenyl-6-methoxyphenol hydroxylase-like FAD-dependent oxidoreductase